LDAIVRHEHIVFDAHAAPARKVSAGLDREDHAGRYVVVRIGIAFLARYRASDARLLMDFDAQTVAGSVAERVAESPGGESVARRQVDCEARPARRDGRDGPIVRFENGPVDLTRAFG